MRISRSRYESAKRKLAKMESLKQVVETWEDAMRAINAHVDAEKVLALEIHDNGKIKWECETPLAGVVNEKGV